jgi:hypothetical protein
MIQPKRNKVYLNRSLALVVILGFMVKLPAVFHHYDKALHATFYFCAVLYFGLQFPKKWLMVLVGLLVFGFVIEFAQAFSNKISLRLIGKPIHGRFDIEDIRYNIKGLFYGALLLFLILKLKGSSDAKS